MIKDETKKKEEKKGIKKAPTGSQSPRVPQRDKEVKSNGNKV